MVSPSFLHFVFPTNFRNLRNSDFDLVRKYMEMHHLYAEEFTPISEVYPTRDVDIVAGAAVDLERNKLWVESGANYYVISDDEEDDEPKGGERGYIVIEE